MIFTNGAYSQGVGGRAAIVYTTGTSSNGRAAGISNYEMEAVAPSILLNHLIDLIETDNPHRNNSLAIFSDSQAALQLLNSLLIMRTA